MLEGCGFDRVDAYSDMALVTLQEDQRLGGPAAGGAGAPGGAGEGEGEEGRKGGGAVEGCNGRGREG